MMLDYVLRLLLLVPLVAGMAFAAIWLWKRVQPGMSIGSRERAVRVIDAVPLGTTGRLAVVEFGGKRLLVGVSRGAITLLSETAAPKVFPVIGDDALD